ncbi:hypothetical protein ABT383_09610 [Streptomyces humidus]|uniref:hypothetical protein n=1 Tax=Streptomyces humidus TaxID=52259 RepID=UPI00167E6EA4|nr:hypothetical protein [Streptomyces humidus]
MAHSRFFPHVLHVSGGGDGREADAAAADALRGSPEAPEEHPVRAMRAAANTAPYRAAGLALDWIMMVGPVGSAGQGG